MYVKCFALTNLQGGLCETRLSLQSEVFCFFFTEWRDEGNSLETHTARLAKQGDDIKAVAKSP